MLSWMRWLTSWFWNIVNSEGTSGGFLRWFSDHWVGLTVFLIIAGVFIDWLIWMIRWRPYWLWLRKRQIIYEDAPEQKKKKRRSAPAARRPEPEEDDYTDPFASVGDDPYAPAKSASPKDDMAEWDSTDDPYARPSGGTAKKVNFGRQDSI